MVDEVLAPSNPVRNGLCNANYSVLVCLFSQIRFCYSPRQSRIRIKAISVCRPGSVCRSFDRGRLFIHLALCRPGGGKSLRQCCILVTVADTRSAPYYTGGLSSLACSG